MANQNQFTVPLAIDPKGFLTGLDEMEAGLVSVTAKAKASSAAITETFVAGGKAGDAFAQKMETGAIAAKKLSDAAKTAGVDLNKTFSGDNLKTDGISQKVTQFIAKLKDAAGKPVDFKFNIDQTAVSTLVTKITQAKTEVSAFNVVLDSAKSRLAGLEVGTQAFTELNDQIVTAETFLKNLGATTEATEVPFVSLRAQLKQMKIDLQTMEEAGKGGTKEFTELAKRAGEVADQIQDTSQRINNLASDTKGLDAGITAIRGLAGAFAVGQGALAAFGEQNEEAAKAIQKVQGALAILQGIQEVANVLNKDSALMVYLNTFARKENTVATVAQTAAIEGEAVATEAATVATNSFTAALLANPIVAILATVALLATALYKYATATDTAEEALKKLNAQIAAGNEIMTEQEAILQRSQKVRTANNDYLRKLNSERLSDELAFLNKEKFAQLDNFVEIQDAYEKAAKNKKISFDEFLKISKEYNDAFAKLQNTNADITATTIKRDAAQRDEQIKLQQDFLKEKQVEAGVEIEIAKQAKDYLNQISQAKISELRDGQEKELLTLRQGLKEKIQAIDQEQAAKLKGLKDQKANLEFDRQLADENGKKLIDQQTADLQRQIDLTIANGAKIKALKVELRTAEGVAEQLVNKKFAEQNADIEFQVANTLLSIQRETAKQKEDILTLTAQHEIDIIERTNQTKAQKELQQAAIEKKLAKDIADSNLEFALKQIEVEKSINDAKLKNLKLYFQNTRDAQATFHLLEAQNELEAAKKAVLALEAANKALSDQEVKDADARVKAAEKAVKDATKNAKPQSIGELLFPNDSQGQFNVEEAIKAINEVGKAVDSYYSTIIAAQQRKIDAQKKAVQQDEDQVNSLKEQLKTEQDLRDKGYANNVDGIKGLIAEKNKQREDDVRKQDEYQKKIAKIQRQQINVQTALQAAQLLTASTNILLHATAEGGVVGGIIGGIEVAAMIAAFIAQRKQAYDAIQDKSTFRHGGIISGKSHEQGGQKYRSIDGTGGIKELEDGEHVTNKNSTRKYLPLLEVINDDKLAGLDDRKITALLRGMGIHLQTDDTHREALHEGREQALHQINQVNVIAQQSTPAELKNIDSNLQEMLNNSSNAPVVYEENGYIVTRKGNTIKKVRKHN